MRRLMLFAAALLCTAGIAQAQTLHLFNFCNTLDTTIGTEVDFDRTYEEASLIASYIGYNFLAYCGKGEDCSNEHLMSELDALRCGKDDIVIFYYSGHGGRSGNDKTLFPQMALKYHAYDQDKFVSVSKVVEKLQAKKPRFILVMTDCCNNVVSGLYPKGLIEDQTSSVDLANKEGERITRNYKKLFLESRGTVVATSSKAGQTSGGNPVGGGRFTRMFWMHAMPMAVDKENVASTWQAVLAKATELCSTNGQQPYYEIHLQQAPSAPAPAAPQSITAPDNSFARELSALLDRSRSAEWRMEQADYLATRYFSSGARVATVARNGSTVVDYESARDFLRRIASSKFIKQVNILKETTDAQGLRTSLKVQEIRETK